MVAEGNVGVAFAMVTAAGLATAVGAALVFVANITKPRLLAGALGFSAGVMIYVSFAELFSVKTIDSFVEFGLQDNEAQRYATLCFFGGVILVYLLSGLVHLLTMLSMHLTDKGVAKKAGGCFGKKPVETPPAGETAPDIECDNSGAPSVQSEPAVQADDQLEVTVTPCDDLSNTTPRFSPSPSRAELISNAALRQPQELSDGACAQPQSFTPPLPTDPDVALILQEDHHQFALKRMGLLTALALFMHNFPEGMATFVAGLDDVSIGGSLAVAIAVHNIPEGVCVALPIYYATGSKWKGFFWAVVSGLSEPLGGLLAWAALANTSPLAYAIVFGIVAGMMVCISAKELLPTALKFDPDARVTLLMFFIGMAFMAASLLLFAI